MSRMRSPNYPGIPLGQAIDLVGEIHRKNRTNVIDRLSAAQDMGYSGLTGRSLKLLGALSQFDLLAKVGKGDVRVTPTAVDILHAIEPDARAAALRRAGMSPKLFREIFERFPDGIPSENVIRSYLVQQGFADVAIGPVIKSFVETNRFLEDARDIESHGDDESDEPESVSREEAAGRALVLTAAPTPAPQQGGYRIMEGERVVFSEETGADQYLKLIAAGETNEGLLEALEDYIRRQRKRLGITA